MEDYWGSLPKRKQSDPLSVNDILLLKGIFKKDLYPKLTEVIYCYKIGRKNGPTSL